MTIEELRRISTEAGLTEDEAVVWAAVELGQTLKQLCRQWPEPAQRCWVVRRRVTVARGLLASARHKVSATYPGWHAAGVRTAQDILACVRNTRMAEDYGKLAAEAGVAQWVPFAGEARPASRGPVLDARELRGTSQLPGVRAMLQD